MISLNYSVAKAGSDYFAYLDTDNLDIDENIKLNIESFAFSVVNNVSIETHICHKLQKLLENCWDFSYGIPTINIKGDLKGIDQVFIGRPIIIYFSRGDLATEKNVWTKELNLIPKFIFVADCTESVIEISTTDHLYVYGYLDCAKKYSAKKPSIDKITITLKQWFPDDYDMLYARCKQRIDEFVVKHKLDITIPGFMFVESDWAKRYHKASGMLNDKYHPLFVMSLPVVADNKSLTVLFPINEQLHKNVYKGY